MKRTTSERSGEDRKATVACVTDQFQCERIIRAGRALSKPTETNLLGNYLSPIDTPPTFSNLSATTNYSFVIIYLTANIHL